MLLFILVSSNAMGWDSGQCTGSREERLLALEIVLTRSETYEKENGQFPDLYTKDIPEVTKNLPTALANALIGNGHFEKSVSYSCRLGLSGGGETCVLGSLVKEPWCRVLTPKEQANEHR